MSRLQAFIDRMLGRTNAEPNVVLGTADDGSSDPVEAGKLSPLRVDPTTGALLVKDTSGGGGGGSSTVNQGTAGSASWKVVEDNSAAIKTSVDAVNTTLGSPLQAGGNVAVTNFPATQPVSGPLTDAQLRASAVPISGTVTTNPSGTQTVSGTVAVSSLPASPAQEHVTAGSPHATRLTDGSSFYKGVVSGDNLGADLRVASAAVSNSNPVPVSDAGGSITIDSAQLPGALVGGKLSVDASGSSVTGPLTDAQLRASAVPTSEANSSAIATNTGRIPSQGQALASASTPVVLPLSQAAGALALQSQLPAALVGGRLDVNEGAWLGSTAPTVGQKAMASSIPVAIASDQSALTVTGTVTSTISGTVTVDTEMAAAVAAGDSLANPTTAPVIAINHCYNTSLGQWQRCAGIGATGIFVQGSASTGAGFSGRPVVVGGVDGSANARNLLTDTSGRPNVAGAAASGSAVAGNPVLMGGSDGTNARTLTTTPAGSAVVTFDGSNAGPFGDLIAECKTPVLSRHWTILNAFDPQQDETVTQANGATVSVTSQRLTLTSGTTNGADACYRSVKTAQYRPGQGFIFRWTAAFVSSAASSTQEFGFGNGANGGGNNAVAIAYNGTTYGLLHRNGGVSTYIPQASWSGDKLNGSGASGVTISPGNLNVFFAHVPFLGAGTIHFYAMLPNGTITRINTIQYPNSSASLEFSDPAFRFYGRVVSTGSTTNLVAYAGSAAAFTVGNVENAGQQWAVAKSLTVNNTTAAILSIRCATTVNSALNNTPLRIRSICVSSDGGNATALVIAAQGVTLGGTPAFAALTGKSATTADNGVTLTSANTIGTWDTAGTTITGGDPIWNTTSPRNSTSANSELEENPLYIFPGQTLTFYATNLGAASEITVAVNGTVG